MRLHCGKSGWNTASPPQYLALEMQFQVLNRIGRLQPAYEKERQENKQYKTDFTARKMLATISPFRQAHKNC
jgi:hypothetical protein